MGWIPRSALGPSLVVLAVVLVAPAASAIEISGKWHFEYSDTSTEFVDVSQAGTAVSLTVNAVPGTGAAAIPFSGTLNGTTLDLVATPIDCGQFACGLEAIVTGDGFFLDGWVQEYFSTGGTFGAKHRLLGNRCECFDGNSTDGDGCDATCRVEPCFSCAGEPSSCSPIPDGGSCSDSSACTTAETCTAGVCSGVPVAQCVDLTGLWEVTQEEFPVPRFWSIEQRETYVLTRDDLSGSPEYFGTIDAATGAFSLSRPQLGALRCLGTNPLSGTAPPDGQTFDASGTIGSESPFACFPSAVTESGVRVCPGAGCPAPTCGDGLIEGSESCDDLGTLPGDGCDAACQVEPGWVCFNEPSTCALSIPTIQGRGAIALFLLILLAAAFALSTPRRDERAAKVGARN